MERNESSPSLEGSTTPASKRAKYNHMDPPSHEKAQTWKPILGSKLVPFIKPHLPGEIVNIILSLTRGEFIHLKYEEEYLRFCNRARVGGFLKVCKSSRGHLKTEKEKLDREGYLHSYVDRLVRELQTGREDFDIEIDGRVETLKFIPGADTVFLQGLVERISKKSKFPLAETIQKSHQHSWLFRVKYPLMELNEIYEAFSSISQQADGEGHARNLRIKIRRFLQTKGAIFSLLTDWRSELEHLQILVGPWEPCKTPNELRKIIPEHIRAKNAEAELGLTEEEMNLVEDTDEWLRLVAQKHHSYQYYWLRAPEGRTWLNSWEEYDPEREDKPPAWFWLGTEEGHRWLDTGNGRNWLRGELGPHNGNGPSSHTRWLKETQQGKDWLQTHSGSLSYSEKSHEALLKEASVQVQPQSNTNTKVIRDDVFLMKPIRKWQFVTFKPVPDRIT